MNRRFVHCAVLGLFALGVVAGQWATAQNKEGSMIYELRTYTTHEGRLPALHARFRDHTIRLFEKHDMRNVVYMTPVDKDNTLVYLISHDSREAAEASWAAFRADPEWKRVAAASEEDGRIVAKVESQFLSPTDYSPLR